MWNCETLHNLQSGPPLTSASTHAVGAGHDYITIITDCTAYVDDPDSAGSFANGPSLAGASTYAAGTGNEYLFISYTHPLF